MNIRRCHTALLRSMSLALMSDVPLPAVNLMMSLNTSMSDIKEHKQWRVENKK